MTKQIQDAYIISATRLPVGKRNGLYASTRPDDLLAAALRAVLSSVPALDASRVDDVIVGCAMPEAEQGLNVARMAVLLAGLPNSIPGVTVNRFCASGLQAIADASARIRLGEADVMIAAGTESMSVMPQIMGNKIAFNPEIFTRDDTLGMAYGMGLTGEKVATQWNISREDQDAFALASHRKACAAIETGHFNAEITPYNIVKHQQGENGHARLTATLAARDEGPRPDTNAETLAALRPAFAAGGTVTAGNSSQMSDGAAALLLVSERVVRELNIQPLARVVSFAVAGVAPETMGIGPKVAIPRALKHAGLAQQALDWIELNEAFAAQSIAVIRDLDLDPEKINPLGGAIALGHPLGATGAIRTATLLHGLRRTRGKYGMVTMCIGTGMGAAGVFEAL